MQSLESVRTYFFGAKGKKDLELYNPYAGGRGDREVNIQRAPECRLCTSPEAPCINCREIQRRIFSPTGFVPNIPLPPPYEEGKKYKRHHDYEFPEETKRPRLLHMNSLQDK